MNNLRKNIVMDIAQFLRYKEFLFNKKNPQPSSTQLNSKVRASFCTLCDDDCICMNSKDYKLLLNNPNNLKR
jgi:hypothetical protein